MLKCAFPGYRKKTLQNHISSLRKFSMSWLKNRTCKLLYPSRLHPKRAPWYRATKLSRGSCHHAILNFFFPFKDSFKDVPIPQFWQHFRGPLLVSPEGHIECATCRVEAVVSSNGTSLLCPKRSQFPDARKAQEQGCFFILKIRVAEITAEKQDEVLAYNDSKSAKGSMVKKTSDIAKEILAIKRAKPDE